MRVDTTGAPLQATQRDGGLYHAVDDPGKGVERRDEHVKERERGEDDGRGELVAQHHEEHKREQRH